MSIEQVISNAQIKYGINRHQIGLEMGGHWEDNIYRIGNITTKTRKKIESAIEKLKKRRN